MDPITKMKSLWQQVYGSDHDGLLETFQRELEDFRMRSKLPAIPREWYKEVVVYSLYVDLFNNDFQGLEDKLPYLSQLGVSCLWLLPILDSPMRDAGFDIKDYRGIRADLLPKGAGLEAFSSFVSKAHEQGIRVIFDIAINHTSNEHPWFIESRKGPDNPYHDYYIWRESPDRYLDARIIFQGIEESNWSRDGDAWFFHRFFDFQPDLNYRNPKVLVEMCRHFLFWLGQGVDGFRADAIPYLWKEEGTACENLEHTHTIVKFFRQVMDLVRPNALLLAEACQKPKEVVRYFGDGDECHAGYHFPLMPQIFKTIAAGDARYVARTLGASVTPPIPPNAQWFTFLRCHDELSLELVYVTEEDRAFIHQAYCKQNSWDFRQGQGISARLAELMDLDPGKILLAFSIMLSLPGTPVLYYGDEFGKRNDQAYYLQQIKEVGKDDTRFLVRGHMEWEKIGRELQDPASLATLVSQGLKNLLQARASVPVFGKGKIQWITDDLSMDEKANPVLAFVRLHEHQAVLCLHNLTHSEVSWQIPGRLRGLPSLDLLGHELTGDFDNGTLDLPPYGCRWILMDAHQD